VKEPIMTRKWTFARFTTVTALLLSALLPSRALADIKAPVDGTVVSLDYTNDNQYQKAIKFLTVDPSKQTDPAFTGNDIAKIKALEDPIRKEIFDKMKASTEVFTFNVLQAAIDNFQMRIYTIQHITDMNAGKIKYTYYPREGTPSVESKKWQLGPEKRPYFFQVKDGQTSYAAISDLMATTTKGECAGAMCACIIWAAARVIKAGTGGADAFDKLHPAGSLNVGFVCGDNDPVANYKGSVEKHRYWSPDQNSDNVVPGDRVYFKNKDDYLDKCKKKNVNGFWQGENAFYVGNNKFSGLGTNADQVNKDDMYKELARNYKKDTGDDIPLPLTDHIKIVGIYRLRVQP
jgi:hypothetical protein